MNTDEEKLKKDINGEIQAGILLLLSLDRFRQHAVARTLITDLLGIEEAGASETERHGHGFTHREFNTLDGDFSQCVTCSHGKASSDSSNGPEKVSMTPRRSPRTNAKIMVEGRQIRVNANRKVDWQQTRAQVARAMHRLVASSCPGSTCRNLLMEHTGERSDW